MIRVVDSFWCSKCRRAYFLHDQATEPFEEWVAPDTPIHIECKCGERYALQLVHRPEVKA